MSNLVMLLNDSWATLEIVGGKGASLQRLINAGLPVPDGFYITTAAYRLFVLQNDLQPHIVAAVEAADPAQPVTLRTASDTIYELFVNAVVPTEIAESICAAYRDLPGDNLAVAVRSSATAEDLPDASFAGQQETFLNVRGEAEVVDAVKRCWASLWTARAIGYRARQEIDTENVALAVVVQELVNAEAAGIMFTANPLNGKRDEAVINAAWGLGEAIVGGVVTPDTITVSKETGDLVERDTAEKLVMTVRTETGTEEQPVPGSLQTAPVLSDAQASELVRLGTKIEELYGMPMDIEWTLSGGMFDIVQARPVTALPEAPIEWAPPDPKGTYMRASVADLMPEPLSPLYITMGIPAQKSQMQPLGKRLTGGDPVLAEDYFTSINNFAYMNAAFAPRSWWWALTSLIPSYPKLLRILVPLWREELHPEYQAVVASKQAYVPAEMTAGELWHEAQELVDAAAYYICGLMFATMGASAGSEGLLTTVYNRMARQNGDPDASALLMGWDNIPVRSEKSLYDIAMWAHEDASLATYILKTDSTALAEDLARPDAAPIPLFPEFSARFQSHLAEFGHIVFQLDFAEPLPLDHPEMLLENIKMYLRGEGVNPHERQQTSEQRRLQTTETMLNRLKGFKLWAFRKALNWGQSMAEVREDALAEIGLAYPKMREMLRELGYRFAAASAVQQPDDIFWLEKHEIAASVENLELAYPLDDFTGHVEERKALNERLRQIIPPPLMPVKERIMGFKADAFISESAESQVGNVLKGVPTSAGRVTAPARVLSGPEDFDQMHPGDVLVAGTTTPAWTPLFAMASAVVTDVGGPLSHGSIVAREYGIPAVMGTGVATRRIEDGQIVTVDGSAGEVILAADEDEEPVAPPTDWSVPDPKATYARGSLAEHTPSPVSPLFTTLGLRIANSETYRLWESFTGDDPSFMFIDNNFYLVINSYIYGAFRLGWKAAWFMMRLAVQNMGPMMRGSVERWLAGRQEFVDVLAGWQDTDIAALSPPDLLDGACTVFRASIRYYTIIQETLPAASTSEIVFSRFYNSLIKRKTDPEFTTLLFGFETMPVRAEKSLFDLATWLKGHPVLAGYVLNVSAEELLDDFNHEAPPEGIPGELWADWRTRFDEHFDRFGRTVYEFDFAHPTPAEAPGPQLEAIKLFFEGKGINPYERHQTAVENREQATQAILNRIGWPRKGWFEKLLKWTQETGSIREDSIADMGMGHPLIRRMFAELGRRFAAGGAIEAAGDIYWLEEQEVDELIAMLEAGQPLPDYADIVPVRKAEWRAALQIIPPVALPEKSFVQKLLGGGDAKEKDGRIVLKGLGTSRGQITAPACVILGPEDFSRMRPGDVLVATTTTPAWTPLFAMASAVVTDIGGPLSHSSIVAREYGIPAVMAARNATRHIQSGQMITVDGSEGTVVLE